MNQPRCQKLLNLALLCLISTGSVHAQSICQSINLEDIRTQPALIHTSGSFFGVVTFNKPIGTVVTPRPDFIVYEQAENSLHIRAQRPVGRTSLNVYIAGKPAFFTIVIDETMESDLCYDVVSPEPVSPTSQMSVRPGRPSVILPDDSDTAREGEWTGTDGPDGDLKPLTREVQGPSYLLELSDPYNEQNSVKLDYRMVNTGQRILVIDTDRLDLSGAGRSLGLSIKRENESGLGSRLYPGDEETGTISVDALPEGSELTWNVVEIGSNQTYQLRTKVR